MESGINPSDQNFYARRQLPPSSPERRKYNPLPHADLDLRSPQLPPKLPFLTTQNLQAATANGFIGGLGSGGGDPDEFYRDYRGVQQSTNGYTDKMPLTASDSRLGGLSVDRHGSTPNNPPPPSHKPPVVGRTHLKSSYRSASSPIDDRMTRGSSKSTSALNGHTNARQQQPSVKDLLKRFDQNNEQPSAPARKPSPKIVTTNGAGTFRAQHGYQARGGSTTHAPSLVGLTTRERDGAGRMRNQPTTTRTTQRTRFAPEDQHSNNTLSSVARAARPRNVVAGANSQASKSMTNLSPTAASCPPQSAPTSNLFGEVTAAKQDSEIGHGIPRSVARRTSESNLSPPSWIHQRGRLEDNVDPSSPTADWYRGATSLDVAADRAPRSSAGHNRNHSDMPDNIVNTMNGVNPTFSTTAATPTSPRESVSRIPRMANRFSGSSESSSVASTRGNSRTTSPSGKGSSLRLQNPDRRPWSPAGRSITPTNRSKTPTRARGTARNADMTLNNNASLKAYISAPLPKLSPPLRSSRPRQPVSSASTTSSRQRVAERSGSPHQARTGVKITRNIGIDPAKPKKSPDRVVDQGPVDFEAHRAKIKRAYTKSIHESEQAEIRRENLRRLQERQSQHSRATSEPKVSASGAEPISGQPRTEKVSTGIPDLLHINTSFPSPKKISDGETGFKGRDSRNLSGVPGAFVDDDDIPHSAISNATEIENEPQTEAPRLSRMVSSQSVAPIMTSNQLFFSDDQFSPEQAMYGMVHNESEIQIMLDAHPVNILQPDLTPTKAEFAQDGDRLVPGSFQDDADLAGYRQPEIVDGATATGDSDISPAKSSPVTLVESGDEQFSHTNFPVHFDMRVDGSRVVPEISYSDEMVSPTSVDPAEGARFGLSSLRTALAPSIMMNDEVRDNLMTPVTEFDYESSDGIEGMNGNHLKFPSNKELRQSSTDRSFAHISSWTDCSVSTNDDYPEQEDDGDPAIALASEFNVERKPTPPPKAEQPLPISSIGHSESDRSSPRHSSRLQLTHTNLVSSAYGELSPLSTREGFGYEERVPGIVSVTPLWPEYTPPLPSTAHLDASSSPPTRSPPPPNFYEKRPLSSLYQTSLNDGTRTTGSRRTSGDASSNMGASMQRSSSHDSNEDSAMHPPDQSLDVSEFQTTVAPTQPAGPKEIVETEAAKKARKRLFQRRMVIKELIDTEAIYLKDMNVVEEIYKGTAEACPKLDSNDINTIFRNTAKIVAFSTKFLEELKSAGASVYSPRSKGRPGKTWTTNADGTEERFSTANTLVEETDEQKDRKTFVGANFGKHLKEMQEIYTDYLKNSETASARLHALQTDSAVKVWLGECNLVAKDLTQAWDIDALLVKPVQRITRYQLLLHQIVENTLEDHPDYQALQVTCRELAGLLKHIDDLKRRIQVVGRIVGRKRKESDVRAGLAKAFGRRSEKFQTPASNRPPDDEVYVKLHEKFGDDYLRLQVVLRDVEFYTRQCTTYVNDFLRYLSSMELVMRMSASPYPELESKWARFNMSMRDMGTVALEDHITSVRLKVIEPFEQVIRAYGPPGLAMKKRSKRRLDYEKSLNTKTKDPKLAELVDQYEALNETLKLELPKLSSLTETIGNIALIQFVSIQVQWYSIWQEKVRVVLEESQIPKDIEGIINMFSRDYKYVEARAQELGIVNGNFDNGNKARPSQSTQSTQDDDSSIRSKSRPSNLSSRPRGPSINGDRSPSLPTPDFVKHNSGQFTFSPLLTTSPGLPSIPYAGTAYPPGHSRGGSGSPATPEPASATRPYSTQVRPSTSRSHTSDAGVSRPSVDYTYSSRRGSGYSASHHVDGPPSSTRPYSGLFNSALPDGPEDSQRSSRASSRDRAAGDCRFRVLYLAASLFEFNISATKSEAGYPYLTYQAGEIFDVLAEKGELWLAKNQDDPNDVVGWIWSKHFARLATD